MSSRFQKAKEAMKSPPPERLAKIEYQSHFLQMMGVGITSIVLVSRGFWYVLFAFIFSLGVSYSQGMSAYVRYNNIMNILGKINPADFEKDISPTRRRSKIVTHVFGKSGSWVSSIVAVAAPMFFLNLSPWRWYYSISYFLSILLVYVLTYFFIMYHLAYPLYKEDMKIK